MELFFLCGLSIFILFISLSFVPHFFNHKSDASISKDGHVFREHVEIVKSQVQGELLKWEDVQTLQGAFMDAIYADHFSNTPNGLNLQYWNTNLRHNNPGCSPEPECFDPSRFEGKEYARLEMSVFMHNIVRIRSL